MLMPTPTNTTSHITMSSNTYHFGGPPPFGPPPCNNNNNHNAAPAAILAMTAPAAVESPSSIDSSIFADIDIIICGIKDDVGALLSSLQQYARKRGDGSSVGLSVALDVNSYLQRQQHLDGCLVFIRELGKVVVEMARRIFAGDATMWDEKSSEESAGESEEGIQGEDESGDVVDEEDDAGEQEMSAEESESIAPLRDGEDYLASEEDTARVQWMEAHEAMEIVRRLGKLQDDLLRDIPLLSEEERAHRCTTDNMMDDDHWSDVLEERSKGGRYFWG